MIDRAINTFNVDTHRIYLTGYSQGSHGAWTMLSRYDGRFAAAVPVSGGIPASDFVAARLIDTPIFAFHARDDATTSVFNTRNIINGILAADGQALPTYLSANDPRNFLITNSNLPFHQALSAEAHQLASISDFFITDPRIDLLYYVTATGGHDGMLSALSFPEVYDWMFSHTTAVPEPSISILAMTSAFFAASCRPMRRQAIGRRGC
jgi:pimeloyl-ACP methyl ester carboxylesterase